MGRLHQIQQRDPIIGGQVRRVDGRDEIPDCHASALHVEPRATVGSHSDRGMMAARLPHA